MKKWLTLGLSLLAVIAALSLSACGQQESTAPEAGGGETMTAPQGESGTGGTTEGGTEATPAEPATGGGQ